jgi:hypothetical protein
LRRFVKTPSPALVIAVIALFVSLGGVSYGLARNSVTSRAIKNNTIRSRDIHNPGVTGRDVKNESLGTTDVKNGSLRFSDFACPAGTTRFASACFENTARSATTFSVASNTCATVGGRLPTASELLAFRNAPGITLGADEMSSNVYDNFRYVTVTDAGALGNQTVNTARQYRCVIPLKGR